MIIIICAAWPGRLWRIKNAKTPGRLFAYLIKKNNLEKKQEASAAGQSKLDAGEHAEL